MRGRRVLWWAAVVSGIACAAPATWWLGGGNRGAADPGWDYFWQPPAIAPAAGHALGVFALVSVMAAAILVGAGIRRATVRRTLVPVLIPLASIAAYVGFSYSVATAPVIGANIGAGMLFMFAIPVLLGMIAWATIAGGRHRRARLSERR